MRSTHSATRRTHGKSRRWTALCEDTWWRSRSTGWWAHRHAWLRPPVSTHCFHRLLLPYAIPGRKVCNPTCK